jgi:cytidylate kinase
VHDVTIIAIDGPGGSGKSTVARHLAERLGLEYLDTGAMYRAVAFAALRRGIDPSEAEPVAHLVEGLELTVDQDAVVVDGVDATIEIRGPEVTRAVSLVAANPAVRTELRSRQREWAATRRGGLVVGRDMATVVSRLAPLTVFPPAGADVRAERRSQEVSDLDYETVAADLARRDTLDEGREDSPLAQADDALVLDTSGMSIDEVVEVLVAELER